MIKSFNSNENLTSPEKIEEDQINENNLRPLNFNDFGLVASSPELLVQLRNEKVTIRPIAGTRKRGRNASEDLMLSKDLLSDQKELAEHLMLLDLGRNDVGRVAKNNTVKVTEKMIIEYYSHVMHIVSNVEGLIDKKYDAVDALKAGFPAGTVFSLSSSA